VNTSLPVFLDTVVSVDLDSTVDSNTDTLARSHSQGRRRDSRNLVFDGFDRTLFFLFLSLPPLDLATRTD